MIRIREYLGDDDSAIDEQDGDDLVQCLTNARRCLRSSPGQAEIEIERALLILSQAGFKE